jgi:hypothetical protein
MLINGNSAFLEDKGDNKARIVILVDLKVVLAAYEGLVGNDLQFRRVRRMSQAGSFYRTCLFRFHAGRKKDSDTGIASTLGKQGQIKCDWRSRPSGKNGGRGQLKQLEEKNWR